MGGMKTAGWTPMDTCTHLEHSMKSNDKHFMVFLLHAQRGKIIVVHLCSIRHNLSVTIQIQTFHQGH